MDFSVIFQLRTKKFWWMDVIFYFVISLLVATIFCYLIFLVKDGMIKKQISDVTASLKTVGTEQQKQHEAEVINYKGKINDFALLLKNHEFASNVFAFMQSQTMPNVWFSQFSLDQKNNAVQLSGESDSIDAFSRQVDAFENNKYIKDMGTINSSLGQSARIAFNLGVVMNSAIFTYIPTASSISTTSPTDQSPVIAITSQTPENPIISTSTETLANPLATSDNQKLITSFDIILNPPVVGVVNESNYTINLTVPYGSDIKSLTPTIVTSPNATVLPASLVSQDFTNSVIYRVTAQDGSTQDYRVKVAVGASPETIKKSSQAKTTILIIIFLAIVVIIVIVIVFIFLSRKNNQKNNNNIN